VTVPQKRLMLGKVPIDVVTFDGALDAIGQLVAARQGGYVVTPNIDHIVIADHNAAFEQAYAQAALSLVDGMPLVWASRILGQQLPEKISGADLIFPLMKRAAENKWRVYLMGAGPGVAEKAAEELHRRYGTLVVGCDAPRVSVDPAASENAAAVAKIQAAKPDLVLVALGAPKQEIWMHRCVAQYAPAVALGIGAGLDFIAGTVKRAPKWMSNNGLEWAYRLSREPKRMWRRYLVDDPRFLLILARTMQLPRSERVVWRG
jgi:N-acetylglucosaminyldiphosphoundecaprenol N-acetyl-beta-D-mannosaminyltransferase